MTSRRLSIACVALLLMAAPAMAGSTIDFSGKSRMASGLALPAIVSVLGNWTADDISAAQALATQIEGLQDTIGKACWASFSNLGAVIKAHPLPLTLKLATDIEAARLFAMALKQVCTNPNCSQMWNDLQNQITALAPINAPFQLASICAKIP